MLLFRSEEHLERWLAAGSNPTGERMTTEQQWLLARTWFEGRDHPDWRPREVDEVHEVFRAAGLEGPFWTLS
jgi:hypothetical protein